MHVLNQYNIKCILTIENVLKNIAKSSSEKAEKVSVKALGFPQVSFTTGN